MLVQNFIHDLKLIVVPKSLYVGRLRVKGTLGKKSYACTDDVAFKKACYTVHQQSSLVDPYIKEHKKILRSEFLEKSEAWITHQHIDIYQLIYYISSFYFFFREIIGRS